MTALTRLQSLKNEEAIKGWLRTICFHKFIDKSKRNKYLLEIDDWSIIEKEGKLLQAYDPEPETEVIVSEEIRDL